MKIKEILPFAHCNSCPEFILNVNEQVVLDAENLPTRELIVRCKNQRNCTFSITPNYCNTEVKHE